MKDLQDPGAGLRSLAEIGLAGYAPYLMNRIMGRYNASLRAEMARLGLTMAKMRALAVLSVLDQPLIRELALHAVVEPSTLSRALDGLVAEGLVRREADAEDSRSTRVSLTDQGRRAFNRLWPHMAEAYDRLFQGIPEEKRLALVATLRKVLANTRRPEF